MDAKKDVRPVRVKLSLSNAAFGESAKKIFAGAEVQFVESFDEADLVIFDDVRKVENGFSKERTYVYLVEMHRTEKKPALPINVSIVPINNIEAKLVNLIDDLARQLEPIAN
ncbi:MAG: hypothetical protein EXS59_02190 [Candidatus Taylorbacteria bacterium]|nr:hypothetical protein [Candidatus Taylorbacteria bacterium]